MSIPNSNIISSKVINYTYYDNRKIIDQIDFKVSINTNVDDLITIIENKMTSLEEELDFTNFDESISVEKFNIFPNPFTQIIIKFEVDPEIFIKI